MFHTRRTRPEIFGSFSNTTGPRASAANPVTRGAFVVLSLFICGCGGQAAPEPASETASTAASAPAADSGAQTVNGKSPAASGNFPSIVVLEPIGGGDFPAQAAPPTMDQEQQTFIPSILLVRTGQPVDFLNHDDVLHNVRVKNDETKESAFNVAIPTGEKYTHTFQRDGFYDVGCDIHPGMSAQIVSTSSPFTVLADPSGAFTIANVPNGPYKATAYSGASKIEKEVNIAAGSSSVDLTGR
jgi:plastocyanin